MNLFKNKSSPRTMYATKCSMIPSLTYKNIPLSILMMKCNLLIAYEGSRFELFCTEAQVSFTYETTFSSVRNCCYWFPFFLWVNCVHFWKNKLCYIEDIILDFSFSSVLENFLAIKVNRHSELRRKFDRDSYVHVYRLMCIYKWVWPFYT